MLPNIVLIGFMGSGKSSVGKHLAALTGHRFLDTDEMISIRHHCSISAIFSRHGEPYFREEETRALRSLTGICGVVLATGGGIVVREENRQLLRELGPVVWLDAEPDLIFERVSRNSRRPLLQTENPRASFDALREERTPVYENASDLRIDSTGLSHEEVAKSILQAVQRFRAEHGACEE